MYCKYCGADLENDSRFCSKCGRMIEKDETAVESVSPACDGVPSVEGITQDVSESLKL